MKNNQPVSNNEVYMREGSVIVSRTDLKGLITYINQDFLDISGFTEIELIGKSHNVVRHPDMPAAAFQDLWETSKLGKPWVGMVKNRCKNGDHYWVEANVTPVFKDGQIHEYMSVRKMPSREQIASAETLYRNLNTGTASLAPTMMSRISALFSIRTRLIAAFSIMALIILIMGLLGEGQSTASLSFMFFGIVLAMIFIFLTISSVIKPLEKLSDLVKKLQEDPVNTDMDINRSDEIGDLQRSLKSIQIKLGYDIMEAREAAERAQRIMQALDNVTSNVMLADTGYNIIYMNNAVQAMFAHIEPNLKEILPDFDARQLMGKNIDIFHKTPAHQRGLLDNLSSTYVSKIEVGGRVLTITANPVKNSEGIRRGTVVEWQDITEQVVVEKEVENIVNAGQQGDLNQRIEVDNKTGFYKQLGSGINQLLDVVSDSLNSISTVMSALSEGNLTKNMEGDYAGEFAKIQNTINSTMSTLQSLVSNIRGASGHISSAANEISQGNVDLSQRTEEQAASLEETASSMEELTSTVRQNADNSRQANLLASGARDEAQEGGKVIDATILAMKEINDSSKKIEDIIGVIDEIAFQTNLLALNAAVEAARAGEQGKGFAVVASEVRSLAQRSAAAAKEIKSLIKDSVENVDEGTRLVDESGNTLNSIVNSVRKVSDIIAEIAASSSEQSAGIEQINQAVTQLDEVTQQNAALGEEAAAASESMDEQARDLNNMVGFFELGENEVEVIPQLAAKTTVPVLVSVSKNEPKAQVPVSAPVVASDDSEWEEF